MKTIGDILANILTPGPNPAGKPTRLLTQGSIPPRTSLKGELNMSRMTRDSLKQIIAQIDNDPLAGMGTLSKQDLLIDRLLAHFNTVEQREVTQPTTPRPIITEPQKTLVLDKPAPSVSTVKQSFPGQTTIIGEPIDAQKVS